MRLQRQALRLATSAFAFVTRSVLLILLAIFVLLLGVAAHDCVVPLVAQDGNKKDADDDTFIAESGRLFALVDARHASRERRRATFAHVQTFQIWMATSASSQTIAPVSRA
jgi:hypothetical protein